MYIFRAIKGTHYAYRRGRYCLFLGKGFTRA